jgi:integrase
MASTYTRAGSPYFWIRYRTPDGTWKGKSTGIRIDAPGGRRTAAVKAHLESARETDLRSSGHGTAMQQWVPNFLQEHYQARHPKTYLRYTEAWTALCVFLAENGVITAPQFSRQFAKQYPYWRIKPRDGLKKVGWNTALFELKVMGVILQRAVERDEIVGNPCFKLGYKRERAKEKQAITIEDQLAIEAKLKELHAPEWMLVSWAIAIRQGCRISETSVPLDKIDLLGKPPTITFKTKGDRVHIAPLHPELIPVIKRLKREKASHTCLLPPNAARTWHNWLQRKIGFKQYSIHSTRVTVVTRLAADNYSQPMIKDYVGHASTTVNDVYRKLKPRHLTGLSASLNGVKAEKLDSP